MCVFKIYLKYLWLMIVVFFWIILIYYFYYFLYLTCIVIYSSFFEFLIWMFVVYVGGKCILEIYRI